jgi:hypothetical protein
MNLDRRQPKLLGNVRVLDSQSLIKCASLNHFGDQRTRRDSGSTAKGLEFRVNNSVVLVNLNLQFHDVTTSRSSDQPSANV